MYAYAVTTMDTSGDKNIELCFGIYLNEKKASAVAKELNMKAKEIQIIKHSEEDTKKLEELEREYEHLLRDKFMDKNSFGVYYFSESINYYWNVRQIVIME